MPLKFVGELKFGGDTCGRSAYLELTDLEHFGSSYGLSTCERNSTHDDAQRRTLWTSRCDVPETTGLTTTISLRLEVDDNLVRDADGRWSVQEARLFQNVRYTVRGRDNGARPDCGYTGQVRRLPTMPPN